MSWGTLWQGCQRTGSISCVLAKSLERKVSGQVYTSFPDSELRLRLLGKLKKKSTEVKLCLQPNFLLPGATQFTQLTSCLGQALGVAVG